jgi:predicted component of type VI protein secretion system
LTITIFKKKPIQKDSPSELKEIKEILISLQESEARSRRDMREIVRDEMMRVLNNRNRKGYWSIA